MDALVFSLMFTGGLAVIFLIAAGADRRVTVAFALITAFLVGLDDLVTGLAPQFLSIPGVHWNWSGKVLSLVLSATAISTLRISRQAVGLQKPTNWKIGVAALVVFVVWGSCLGILFRPGPADPETLAFQATMPGFAEELVYRGIAPAVLLGLIWRRSPASGIPWALIVATSVAFGFWHGLSYSKGHFSFDPLAALFPLIGSIPGGWLRFKTESLLFPILGHAVANVAFHVAGSLMA